MAITQIWWDGTNVLKNSGDSVPFDASQATLETCCCDTCPESAPNPGPCATYYHIDNYTDGDLSACTECTLTSADLLWKGEFYGDHGVQAGYWNGYADPGVSGGTIDTNKALLVSNPSSHTGIVWEGGAACWRMKVVCSGAPFLFTPYVIWEGTKSGGACPSGTYTRVGGCDSSPTTLDVVEGKSP